MALLLLLQGRLGSGQLADRTVLLTGMLAQLRAQRIRLTFKALQPLRQLIRALPVLLPLGHFLSQCGSLFLRLPAMVSSLLQAGRKLLALPLQLLALHQELLRLLPLLLERLLEALDVHQQAGVLTLQLDPRRVRGPATATAHLGDRLLLALKRALQLALELLHLTLQFHVLTPNLCRGQLVADIVFRRHRVRGGFTPFKFFVARYGRFRRITFFQHLNPVIQQICQAGTEFRMVDGLFDHVDV